MGLNPFEGSNPSLSALNGMSPYCQEGDAMPSRRPAARPRATGLPPSVVAFAPLKVDAGPWTVNEVGWKGLSLLRMASAGLPVPPGFVVPVSLCQRLLDGQFGPADLARLISRALADLDRATLQVLGSDHPPLYSVRCSPSSPLPGLMPPLLNVGLTDAVMDRLMHQDEGDFASDCLSRLIPAYAEHVLSLAPQPFEAVPVITESPGQAAERCRRIYLSLTGQEFAPAPQSQVTSALLAALRSWDSPRARLARNRSEIAPGLAVVVQAMVFGNRDSHSATGIAFTRDPSTGQNEMRGEYLPMAQGRDLFSGVRRPLPLATMRQRSPRMWQCMEEICRRLEKELLDVQDFEFTIEKGRLYLLQTRTARRSAAAAIRIAVELVDDSVIVADEAVRRVEPPMVDAGLHPMLDGDTLRRLLAKGLPASPGAASGRIAFTAQEAISRASQGERILLVRRETEAADVAAMAKCDGILTSTGGMTSHAAVVARGMGVPCIVGASELTIDAQRRRLSTPNRVFVAGDALTLDGTTGEVYEGAIPIVPGELGPEASRLLQWADRRRRLRIYANADTPTDARLARSMGAQGIGLCRTEHMFFQQHRISGIRRMILCEPADVAGRRRILEELLPMQRQDFIGLFEAMEGDTVTIRLLDPPVHEFLPRSPDDLKSLARDLGRDPAEVAMRIEQLRETNPMLGHRGCRLCLTTPEILEMQVQAIVEAGVYCLHWGRPVRPAILLPMVMDDRELAWLVAQVRSAAEAVMRRLGVRLEYDLGTMIEVPRAALLAGRLAPMVDFFSFGTNDLTQMTCGISRDDSQDFLADYLRAGIFPADPFARLDMEGVGQLVQMAVQQGRAANPKLQCGLCGEQAGEAATIAFCEKLGMDYVSCSPYRIPAARLAAARCRL